MVDHDSNGRPQNSQSSAWRALHVEGILWDGPIAVVDGANQLSLRLIATTQRLVFTRGGEFVLDIPRDWLTPPPHLNPDGSVNVMVDTGEGGRPERLRLIARDGRRLAVDLIAALNKSRAMRTERSPRISAPGATEDVVEPAATRGYRPRPARAGDDPEPLAVLAGGDFPPTAAVPVAVVPVSPEDHLAAPVYMSDFAPPPREADWSLQPIVSTRGDRIARRSWAIRLSGLIALLIIAAAFGSGRMPALPGRDLPAHIPGTSIDAPFTDSQPEPTTEPALARVETTTPTREPQAPTTVPNTVEETAVPPSETSVSLGVGGMTESAETAQPAAPTSEPTSPPSPTQTPTSTPTAEPTNEPTEEPADAPAEVVQADEPDPTVVPSATSEPEPTAEPTDEPTTPPTAEPTAEPTLAPSATSEPEPTATATAEPTLTPSAEPTETPAPEPIPTMPEATVEPAPTTTETVPEPTATPSETPEPTATPTPKPTATETPEPSPTPTPTERPSFSTQDATLQEGELPAQAFAGGEFRYTVESAVRAPKIDALGLTPVDGAEWVAVLLHAENWSDQNARLRVGDHQLLTYGDYGVAGVAPDPVSKEIAKTLKVKPAIGVNDSTLMAPGDGQRLVLVYLIRPDTTVLQLTTGQSTIDLTSALGGFASMTNPGNEPTPPELMEVEVVEVLDGQSILVESEDGARTRVRYLGVEAPVGDTCFAAKSKKANKAFVGGETVYLERERTNRGSNSRIERDVWIEDADGNLTLVAAELAAQGSVVAMPVEPDIRFAGWIEAAQEGAVANGLGLWDACGGLQTPEPGPAG